MTKSKVDQPKAVPPAPTYVGASNANEPRNDPRKLKDHLNLLDAAISGLDSTLLKMLEKLGPVLAPPPTDRKPNTFTEIPSDCSETARSVIEAAQRVLALQFVVENFKERIDL